MGDIQKTYLQNDHYSLVRGCFRGPISRNCEHSAHKINEQMVPFQIETTLRAMNSIWGEKIEVKDNIQVYNST